MTRGHRKLNGHRKLRLVEDFKILHLAPDFEMLHLTCDFQILRLTPARRNVSKSENCVCTLIRKSYNTVHPPDTMRFLHFHARTEVNYNI